MASLRTSARKRGADEPDAGSFLDPTATAALSSQILHLDFVALTDAAGDAGRRGLIEAAATLALLEEVISVGVIEADVPASSERADQADFDLVFFFVLRDFAALEPFGTNERYSRFLQGSVAPALRAFAGADVRLEADFPAPAANAACLALTAPDETYDWEVREALEAWLKGMKYRDGRTGLAVGERQRYRGLALAFGDGAPGAKRPADKRFGSTLISGRARTLS